MYADPARSNYFNILVDKGFDVLTFDLYGHGGSESPDTDYSAELFASQMSELCLLLDINKPFTIIAHSMGASVAVTFAHRHPGLVKKMILLSPSVVDKPMEFRLRFALHVPVFREILSSMIIPTFGEGTNKDNPGMVRACYRLLQTRLRVGGSWNAGNLKAMEMLREIARTNLANKMFILWGENDTVVPFDQCSLLTNIIPYAKLCVLGEADHMSFSDGSDFAKSFFADRVFAFLENDFDSPFHPPNLGEYFSKEPLFECASEQMFFSDEESHSNRGTLLSR